MLSSLNYLQAVCEGLAAEKIKVAHAYCLHGRHAGSSCDVCGEACPQKAIKEGVLDEDKCLNCGLCAARCPAGAIYRQGENLYLQVREQAEKKHTCVFACHKAGMKGAIKLPCLLNCDESLLLTAVFYGADKILLLAETCIKCPEGDRCLDILAEKVAAACRLSTQFGKRCSVVFNREKFAEHTAALQGSNPLELSRRQFLQGLRHGSKNLLGHIAVDIRDGLQPEKKECQAEKTEKYLPYRWYVLKEIFRHWGRDYPAEKISCFGRISMASSCHGCGACAAVCPTGALLFKEEGEKRIVLHRPWLCTGCGLCQEICMQKSITLDMGVTCRDLSAEKPSVLISCGHERVTAALGSMENRLAALWGCELKKN